MAFSVTGGITPAGLSISPNITMNTNPIALQALMSQQQLRSDMVRDLALCCVGPRNRAGTELAKKCIDERTKEYIMNDRLKADLSSLANLNQTQQSMVISTIIDPSMIKPR